MSSENECLLGDVAELVRGVAYKPDSLLQSGQEFAVPLLRATNIGTNTLELKEVLHVPSHLVKQAQYLRKYDVVIAMSSGSRSAVGRLAQLRCDWFGTFGAFCGAIRPIAEKVDAEFLGYLLYTPEFRARIETYAAGTAIMNLSRENLLGFPIRLPTCKQQRAIAQILGAIDDRITLLRETNATLEAIAQALFKSWFVDFDPVRAKMEGRAPEGMDEATAALFPDALEETELGPVPKGWRVVRLDSFIELTYGKALKAENRKAGQVPVYGSGGITGWHDQALVEQASIIVGRKGTVGSLYWESRPFFPIDTVFYVKSQKPLIYCHLLLKTLGLDSMNTDAAVPGLNRENVYRLLVTEPTRNVLTAFDNIASALRMSMDENERKAQTLNTLRDTLLPRLISGQLRVPEATLA